ncbi:unnamed protein product [Caenorhabditis angaria]|uniref:Peptidase M13 C-terminal domain-containing protein n=1 Tax=Caenorhabditis angaria TaxID=860376 RepID=A0A9P1N9V5_9PELO|nr:unnamed protein product [Caenorhabditis angaria]
MGSNFGTKITDFYWAAEKLENDAEFMAFVGASLLAQFDINLIFSNVTKDCIQRQFANSCDIFKESFCHVPESQFSADLIGFRIAYDLYKIKSSKIYSEKQSISGISQEKLFFYAFAIGWCEQNPAPQNIRVNAVISQIPEFRKIFECRDDSPMVTTNREQCVVFGRDASTLKKTFF